MSRRTNSRSKGLARMRRRLRPQYVVLLVVFAGYLSFQTWAEHRLDTLRKDRVEFEERIIGTRASLAAAREEFDRQSEQARIVSRAKKELGFIDSRVGDRTRLALPALQAAPDEPMLWRLAGGLDRFGGIRDAFASEENR